MRLPNLLVLAKPISSPISPYRNHLYKNYSLTANFHIEATFKTYYPRSIIWLCTYLYSCILLSDVFFYLYAYATTSNKKQLQQAHLHLSTIVKLHNLYYTEQAHIQANHSQKATIKMCVHRQMTHHPNYMFLRIALGRRLTESISLNLHRSNLHQKRNSQDRCTCFAF